MYDTLPPVPIIKTQTYETIKIAIEQIANRAGLGVMRGPVGIGKSFALGQIKRELHSRYRFLVTTARIENVGCIRTFANTLLLRPEGRTGEAIEALENTLTYPYERHKRNILIVDESQGLKINVMEMLRGIWDEGNAFRRGNVDAPACGMLFIGNERFLSRQGTVKSADYAPFMDRLTLQMKLERPSRDELMEYARHAVGPNEGAICALAEFGVKNGNFRSMEKAAHNAHEFAGGETITAEVISEATFFMRGL